MKQVLFMAMLAAGLMLAGCAKEDSSGMETKDNTGQQALIKEQIVGVWRNGDYWVSFSEDGFMCGYISDKCIMEGDYNIDGNTVIVSDGYRLIRAYGKNTSFAVNSISESKLSLTATYNDLTILYRGDEGLIHQITQNYSFERTQETPCIKNNPLIGKICVLPMNVWYIKGVGPNAVMESAPGTCTINVEKYNIMNIKILPNLDEGYNAGDYFEYMYVYLPPKLYMIDISTHGGGFEPNRPMKIYEPSFGSDGSLTIPYVYPENIDKWLKDYQ